MMNELILIKWNMYFNSTRQVGHTYTAMNGVLNNPKAKLVCLHEQQRNMFPKDKTFNINQSLKGFRNPVVFDNYTIQSLIEYSLFERVEKQKIKDAIEKCLKIDYGDGDDEYRFVEDLLKELNLE